MKIYIAGKITDNPNYKKEFFAAERALLKKGHSVMNPARLLPCKEFTYADYISVSRSMQAVCKAVLFLPNWKLSKGALDEYDFAHEAGQKVFLSMNDIAKVRERD
ncbi:MAG: DUF4406 domain-containing protein [Treponema sp.]